MESWEHWKRIIAAVANWARVSPVKREAAMAKRWNFIVRLEPDAGEFGEAGGVVVRTEERGIEDWSDWTGVTRLE